MVEFVLEIKMDYEKHIGCLWKPMRGEMCDLNKCKMEKMREMPIKAREMRRAMGAHYATGV